MTGEKSRIRFRNRAKRLLEVRNEFFRQGSSPRPVIDRISELVMPGWKRAVKKHMNHLTLLAFGHRFGESGRLPPCRGMVAAKAVNEIDGWIFSFCVL